MFGFICVILIGTALLITPAASESGEFTNPLTALFTSVSATCVTGLVVVDTDLYWSTFGELVILAMIQVGGLGFMTMGVMLSLFIKRRISPRERILIAKSLNISNFDGTIKLVKRILYGTLMLEGAGAIILSTQFVPILGWVSGIYKAIFTSVSSFCNAGFDVFGHYSGAFKNLSDFAGNYVVNLTVMALIVSGGIGFVVWSDLVKFIKYKKRVTVYTKFVLIITSILILGGTLVIAVFEWNNHSSVGGLPWDKKLLASMFQSVTTRTAGFCTIDNALFTDGTKILSTLLMFIGGASGSTAGGIKVATIGLVIYSAWRVFCGNTEVVIFKRRIAASDILRANAITLIGLVMLSIGTMIICAVDGVEPLQAVFETASASGTVGLTLGITPYLSSVSLITLILLMFFGRVGILTVAYAMMRRIESTSNIITYPETQMLIG